MKLSFIIPLYNAEKYIASCLDNILQVESPSVCCEVIVVDDGSTDSGPDIVEEYARKNGNIRLLHQENGGASAARNRGLDEAEGEYVWFVDADDRINPDAMAEVVEVLRDGVNDVDLVCFNHIRTYEEGREEGVEEFAERMTLNGVDYIRRHPFLYLWNKVFRRECIGDRRFPVGTRNTEDWYFDLVTITDMRHVVCLPIYGYNYNNSNMDSTLRRRTQEGLLRNSRDSMLMHRLVWEEIKKSGDEEKRCVLRTALDYSITGHLYSLFVDRMPFEVMRKVIGEYREMGVYPVKRTFSRKANIFLIVANRPWLLRIVSKLRECIKV